MLPTTEEEDLRAEFLTFADTVIAPRAAQHDELGIERPVAQTLAAQGCLGPVIPQEFGGPGHNNIAFGLLCEVIGRVCSATRSLLTVHNMVAHTITRWGTAEQKGRWLPRLADGSAIGALCITEAEAGSDAGSVRASLQRTGSGWSLSGTKLWVTCGMLADVFLVLGSTEEGPTMVLVSGEAPGITRTPVAGQLGLRGARLGQISFDGVELPDDAIVGRPGFGFSHVASTALDNGRFSVAWGCTGIAQGCLEASARHASVREQFGVPLHQHQLVRRLLTNMTVGTRAARSLCLEAARSRDAGSPSALTDTMVAKYFSSGTAVRAASDAVQIHGASGCAPGATVERHYRDAKVMEIIEGSNEMHQLTICETALRDYHGADGV